MSAAYCRTCGAGPGAQHWPGCTPAQVTSLTSPGELGDAAAPAQVTSPSPPVTSTRPPASAVSNWEATRLICALLTATHHRQHRDFATLIVSATEEERAATLAVAIGMLHEALLHRCVQVDISMTDYLVFLGNTAALEPDFGRLPCTTRQMGDLRPLCEDCGHPHTAHNSDGYCATCQHHHR